MNAVRCKAGVTFDRIGPAGFRILGALDRAARVVGVDLVITSACDGEHSGPRDPHKTGEAYDVRTKNLTDLQKSSVLRAVMIDLSEDEAHTPMEVGTAITTLRFFGFLEAAGSASEHLHIQRKKGTVYP